MLQSMRERLKGVMAYVLVGLISIIFALFGAQALFMGGLTQNTVAEVNGRKITELDVRRALEARKQQLRSMLGENIDPRFLSDDFLLPSIREAVVQQAVLVSAAEHSGLRINSGELDKTILEDTAFHVDGKFDPEHYKNLLRQYAYTPASYRDELRTNHLLNQYQKTFSNTSFVTEKEVADLASLQFETRSFSYITLPLEKLLATTVVSDEEVASFYEQHKDEFMSEAQASIDYILLDKQALLAGMTVSEEDIQAQYDAEMSEIKDKSERHAAHILVEEKADGSHMQLLADIEKKIADGEDFATLAKTYSADSGSAMQGGDVGVTTGSSFVPEFEEALKKLSVGQVSEPVKTQFGYHIIKLLDQKAVAVPTLEQSRERIIASLKAQLVEEQYAEKVEALRDAAKSASTLEAAAADLSTQQFKLAVRKTGMFSRKNPLALLSSDPALRDPQVLDAVFAAGMHNGSTTDLLELNDSHAVVMQLTAYEPAVVQPLDLIRTQVANRLRRDKAGQQLDVHANELLQRLLDKESLESIAAEEKLSVQHYRDKGRKAAGNVEILKKVFEMAKPSADGKLVADSLSMANGDWALVVVEDSKTPSMEQLTAEQRSGVMNRLQDDARHEEFSGLLATLTDDAKIVRRKQPESTP